jgi:hypothetical protein
MFAMLNPWIWVSHSDPWLLRRYFKAPDEKGEKFANAIHGEKKKE